MRDEAEQVRQPELLEQRREEDGFFDGKMQPMAAGLQLRDIGIAVRIVDELMMGDVLQAIVLRRAEEGEHAEPDRRPDRSRSDS